MLELTERETAELKKILTLVLAGKFVADTAPAHRLREKILDTEQKSAQPNQLVRSPENLDFWATTHR